MSSDRPLRRRQGRLLVRPTSRAIPWASLPVVAGISALVVVNGARDGGDPAPIALPIATTFLCVWLCFLFEDPAAETTAGAPTPLLLRRAVRMAIAIPAVSVAWWACTWIGPLSGPTSAMAASFVAGVILALAAAALSVRFFGAGAGLLAVGAVAIVMLVLPVAIGRPPSVDPAHPPWGAPALHWSALALFACVALVLAHIDPAGIRILRKR